MDTDGNISTTEDVNEWAESRTNIKNKRIGFEQINDDTEVSTVFLGTNYSFMSDGPPMLFETMIFGGPSNESCYRCSTHAEALIQHKRICDSLRDWEEIEKTS
jgi:hypothetical protein